MSYWLYCQSCQKWSRSTSSISDDKSCSFCGSLYVANKSSINSAVDREIAEKLRKTSPGAGSPSRTIRGVEPKIQEKLDIIESPPQPEIPEVEVKSDDSESTALAAAGDPEIPLEDKQVEIREEPESPGTGESAEVQADIQTTDIPDELEEEVYTADIPEELEAETQATDIPEELEEEETEISETAKKPKMTRTREKYLEKKRRTKNFPDV